MGVSYVALLQLTFLTLSQPLCHVPKALEDTLKALFLLRICEHFHHIRMKGFSFKLEQASWSEALAQAGRQVAFSTAASGAGGCQVLGD